MANPDASVWSSNSACGSSGSTKRKDGALEAAAFTEEKDSSYSFPHFQATSWRSKAVSGATILA